MKLARNLKKGCEHNVLIRRFGGMLMGRPLVVVLLACVIPLCAMDRVKGANATLDIEPGARSAALGSATMAVDGDYLGLMSNPYQLAGVRYTWISLSHTAYFENTKYDYASVVTPLGGSQGIGFSLSRFGADDIPWIKEGDPLPEGQNYKTLSIADWVLGISYGRDITDKLSLGASFNILYRDMDQTGWGFRGDVGLRYNPIEELYLSTFLKGWTSSAVAWESSTIEYSNPELYLAASYFYDVPYLYGSLGLYWQSAGLFHSEGRDVDLETDEDRGKPIFQDPLDWLSGGRAGFEFLFDFGLSVRLGLTSFSSIQSVTAGAGLVVAKFLKIDYAFESHAALSPVHRVSLSVSPYLFSHNDKTATPHLSKVMAARKPLLENDDDDDAPLTDEKTEHTSVDTAISAEVLPLKEGESDSSITESKQKEPIKEEEIVPSGGVFWEE